MMVRYASYLMAAILPLLLFRWFTPTDIGQIDFWLLWLLAMVIIALPMVYAEIALAYRSGQSPSSGMQVLTREADASVLWRSFSWLGALVAIIIAALALSGASQGMLATFGELELELSMPMFALSVGLMVIAMILSMLGAGTLPIGFILMAIGLVFGLLGGMPSWQFAMTEVSLVEWGHAVALALVSVGAGTGLYWYAQYTAQFQGNAQLEESTELRGKQSRLYRASNQVMPIWALQLVAGLIALFLSGVTLPTFGKLFYLLGVIFVAAYLLHYAAQQFRVKFGMMISLALTLILGLAMVIVFPDRWLVLVLVIVSSIAALLLSVFAGWQMKISHLRKSLNFSNEALYNLWRVAIRILVPLSMILALIGWISEWLS